MQKVTSQEQEEKKAGMQPGKVKNRLCPASKPPELKGPFFGSVSFTDGLKQMSSEPTMKISTGVGDVRACAATGSAPVHNP